MFNNSAANTKIAVLEERLSSYEVMMRKIDEAIQIMGKTSQNISKMLAVHEEKIDNNTRTDESILSKIKEVEVKNTEEHGKVIMKMTEIENKIDEKMKDVDKKVEDVTKFRWILIGGFLIVSFIFSNSHIVVDMLTPNPEPARIESTK